MKADLYNHEERWKNWKKDNQENIPGLSTKTSDLIKQYLSDMENGVNVSIRNKRGSRSTARLNKIAYTLTWVCLKLREHYDVTDITKATTEQLAELFKRMREDSGDIRTKTGTKFKSTSDYVKVTKSFWHWYQKINRKKNKFIEDITEDLDSKYDEKPTWVYLNEKQMVQLIDKSRGYYKPVIAFGYDAGCRPTEQFSLLVEDISMDARGTVFVNIRNEISKGGNCGRKIKLLLCGKEIIQYIKDNNLKPEDQLFFQSNTVVNRYMGELSKELFGDKNSEGGNNYKNLSLYDLRHNSSCFWLPKYKTNVELMYRFGWKSEKYIHYYSEFLGLKDTISEECLFTDITKTELEKQVKLMKKQLKKLEEENSMQSMSPEVFNQYLEKAGFKLPPNKTEIEDMIKKHRRDNE